MNEPENRMPDVSDDNEYYEDGDICPFCGHGILEDTMFVLGELKSGAKTVDGLSCSECDSRIYYEE